MATYKGAFSSDDKETSTGVGLDRDSYNPGRKPNVYVSNAKGKNSIDMSKTLDRELAWAKGATKDREDGFSGPISD